MTLSAELAKEIDSLKATLALATDAYRDRAKLIASLQATIHDKQAAFEVLKREHVATKRDLESVKKDLSRASHEIALLVTHMEAMERDTLSARTQVDYRQRYEKIISSTSWKITAPLRFIGRRLKAKK